jgi:peroxiredoxin
MPFPVREDAHRNPVLSDDHFAELRELGDGQLYGLSTQDIGYQSEAVERLNLPFAIPSDRNLALTRAPVSLPSVRLM